jgi:hypothetical protein
MLFLLGWVLNFRLKETKRQLGLAKDCLIA